ncbi:hypothetical protein WA556_000193 [Blastocystis sp. ATCC 50177/Nand II]
MNGVACTVTGSCEKRHYDVLRKASAVIDGDPLTYWYADTPCPQKLKFHFTPALPFSTIHITFQGGFAASQLRVMVSSDGKKYSQFGEPVYMDDVSTEQSVHVGDCTSEYVMIQFLSNFDYLNRLIVYHVRFDKE